MPSLKEIKGRIASVNSTRKITSAMKMVASSKLHHAQQMIENMLPYENMLERILRSFLASEADAHTVFSEVRPVKHVAFVVYSSNSSLCGGFNANVTKMLHAAVEEYSALGKENILVYPVGRKIAEQVQKMGLESGGDFTELADKPNVAQCIDIARELGEKFLKGEIDRIELIYHHFKSAGSQILQRKTFLPIDVNEAIGQDNDRDLSHKTVTPEMQEYLRKNAKEEEKKKIESKPLYTALLDSNASEHAARMVAMQTATDNADELLRVLNLQYNKSRQQAITNELLDIVGGSVNN